MSSDNRWIGHVEFDAADDDDDDFTPMPPGADPLDHGWVQLGATDGGILYVPPGLGPKPRRRRHR